MAPIPIPAPPRRMTARDAGFLYVERPHALLHIGCVAVLEQPITREDLVERVRARLPRVPRYGQRALSVPFSLGHPSWEDDPEFDPARHVHRWALPSPGGHAELEDAVAALASQPLDRSRPLWEMHLLEGLTEGGCAVYQKVHHCMVDGMAGAQLLEAILDPRPVRRQRPAPLPASQPLPDVAARAGRALWDGVRRRVGTAGRALGALAAPAAARANVERLRSAAFSAVQLATRDVPVLPWNAPIGSDRLVSFTRLPMEGVRSIRQARGGTVNDVVLCALAGGIHHYLEAIGFATRGLEVSALVPVSLRGADEAAALGNRISAMLVPLCVDASDEAPRLTATRSTTDRLKADQAWTGIDALLAMLDELPPSLVAWVGRSLQLGRLANVVATNVPGPRETRWMCGSRVQSLYPMVPIVDGIGLGLAVFSYDDSLQIGLAADARLVPDLEKLRHGIETAFQRLAGS